MRCLPALLLLAVPAWAAQPAGCGNLCGSWQLDAARSTEVVPAVDAALDSYRDPRAKRIRRPSPNDTNEQLEAEMERSLGPIHDRPRRDDLRDELLSVLQAPARLVLDARDNEILIQEQDRSTRRVQPGTPKVRVDAQGTAKVSASWKSERLLVTERYESRSQNSESYALQNDGTLLVTREVERRGLKALRVQSTYRRN